MNHQLTLNIEQATECKEGKHVFEYPLDLRINYNEDGETLTGVCKYCGLGKESKGALWAMNVMNMYDKGVPLKGYSERFDLDTLLERDDQTLLSR